MPEPHIVLHNVSKTFMAGGEPVPALIAVDLSIGQGEFVSLTGHSGSGKSTLLSIIGGMLTPDRGTVSVHGKDIYDAGGKDLGRYRAERVGFVFQSASLLPWLTVRENLLVPALFARGGTAKQAREREALDYLTGVGLAHKANVHPYQLSGGEVRRAALARALMNTPEIVLADEPTGDLDEDTERDVIDLLLTFHRRSGSTLILATHNQELAARAPRTVIMKKGRIAENVRQHTERNEAKINVSETSLRPINPKSKPVSHEDLQGQGGGAKKDNKKFF